MGSLQYVLSAVCSCDIIRSMLEESMSASELVRLSMCCKDLLFLLHKSKGLLYLPVHKTLPCITGLAQGRATSYYLSILKNYYEGSMQLKPRAIMRFQLSLNIFGFIMEHESVDAVVALCAYDQRYEFASSGGRKALLLVLQELKDRVVLKTSNELIATERKMEILTRITTLVLNAYCVMKRALRPGFIRRDELSDSSRMSQPFDEGDSDGYDKDDSCRAP